MGWPSAEPKECPGSPALDEARRQARASGQHILRREIADGAVQADVVVMLDVTQQEIHSQRDRKLAVARQQRQARRQQGA